MQVFRQVDSPAALYCGAPVSVVDRFGRLLLGSLNQLHV